MKKIKIKKDENNKNLSDVLFSRYPKLHLNSFYKLLRKKDIKINNKRINKDKKVYFDDEIDIYIKDELLEEIQIPIIYEDNNIIIFFKDINMEVLGENSLIEKVSMNFEYIKPCHRIDRNTKGLVLCAKKEEIEKEVYEMFRLNKIEKHYIACCYGIPKQNQILEAYLFKDRKKSIVYISDVYKKGYTKIQTGYEIIKENKEINLSILNINLYTGKTHQIRAHLAYVGLPIVGDGKYGDYKINKKFNMNKQALCSYSLKFNCDKGSKLEYLNNKIIKLEEKYFKEILELC